MPRLPLALTVLLILVACTAGPSSTSPPIGPSSPATPSPASARPTPTLPPVVETPPAVASATPLGHGPVGLVNDLLARGIQAEQKSEFVGEPISHLGVQLCVGGEPVQVYVFGTAQEAAAVAGGINPRDPSNFGTTIIEWAGEPKFWVRDRILVLYLGTDEEVEAALVSVLGEPFARGEGRPVFLEGDDC